MEKFKKKKGDYLKNIIKITILFLTLLIVIITIILFDKDISNQHISYAANPNTSDIQLMARAINGEARGETYEGQVAVRSSYIKQSKKFTVS